MGYISREITKRYKAEYPVRLDRMVAEKGMLSKPCRVFTGWMSADKLRAFIAQGCRALDEEGGSQVRFFLSGNGVVYYRREGRQSRYVQSVLTNLGTTETNRYMLENMGISFTYPKPIELISYLISLYAEPGDLVLDSFAGSGTTGHALLQLNSLDRGGRRFILVEIESKIARAITRERLKRAVQGYTGTKGDTVPGLGGGFRFCELGEPLFDESGNVRETVGFSDLARHVFFTESGEPLPSERVGRSPFLGTSRGVGIYLLYNGILEDRSPNGGNVLTRAVLESLPPHDGPKVIYGTACRISSVRRMRENIVFKQIPYEIQVR